MLCKHVIVTQVQATGIQGPSKTLVGASEESVIGRFLAVEVGLLDSHHSAQAISFKTYTCTARDGAQPRGGDAASFSLPHSSETCHWAGTGWRRPRFCMQIRSGFILWAFFP